LLDGGIVGLLKDSNRRGALSTDQIIRFSINPAIHLSLNLIVDMEVHAILKNVRMSAQKMREVVRQIQGLPAQRAQAILAFVPRKGARFVAKTLKSAIANAEDLKAHKPQFGGLKTDRLRVKEAVAQTATTLKRFTPKARGSAGPILKRNCHIKITLSDE
jgi:large subunit ribosomal protein L22